MFSRLTLQAGCRSFSVAAGAAANRMRASPKASILAGAGACVIAVASASSCRTHEAHHRQPLKPVPGAELPTDPVQHGSYDVVIVGAGIIGLATANEVQKRYPNLSVAVVEREPEVAAHQSGHNSGCIHAGMYYQPGTIMAKCCVEGASMVYEYAKKKGIPYDKCGKLICAPTEEGHKQVELLYKRGIANGVEGLRILTGEQVKELEPNVEVYSALESPNTGIVDFGDVTRELAKDHAAAGGKMLFRYEVKAMTNVEDEQGRKEVELRGAEPGQPGPKKIVRAKNVITCAGVHMDHVAQLGGGEAKPQVMTFRGRYYQMKPEYRNIVKRHVYPIPGGGGIPVGVHFTPTIGGYRGSQMIIGPGACMAFDKDGYTFSKANLRYIWEFLTNPGFWKFGIQNFNLSMNELHKDASMQRFLKDAKLLVPSLTDDMVEESFCGVMAQVFLADGSPAKDFIFERGCLEGTTLHLRNAPTPAATSSMAIARELVNYAEVDFGWSGKGGRQ
eukprot:TRINITY_DN4062_c0_g1_i1.p1 TRINITY_DN4062_c0_g1~~TRINITY_DN4062_c0_g1_i1.p1  ORF type:complete len:503 (-),score=89.87 TRINITY_DN4062_c0_g1_i1:218-1726(-)